MKKRIEIEYNWSRVDDGEIPTKHNEALEEDAETRIFDQIKEGYREGELCTSVRFGSDIVPEEDEDEGLEYTGYWNYKTVTL